jgi:folate-binding protein YgfZ
MVDEATAERAAYESVVAFRLGRDVVEASGEDTTGYLQGQLSQDLLPIPSGGSRWSLLLQPQGKVDTWLRATLLDGERWLLDTDPGAGPAMVARLERFRLRMRVAFSPLEWSLVALRGPRSDRVEVPAGLVVADPGWPGVEGRDLLGPSPAVPAGVPEGPAPVHEVLRLRCGVPAMGRELTERTIPAEAGIVERSVSFTKGCYVGQELVARIDSRGSNTPRRLQVLLVTGDAVPEPGAAVGLDDGSPAGEVTSAATSTQVGVVALAYLKRGVGTGAQVTVATAAGPAPARVVAAPV